MYQAGDKCPRCGGQLVTKNGPKGPFIGCTNYRSQGCKFTSPIPAPAQEPDEEDVTNADMLATVVEQLNSLHGKVDLLLSQRFIPSKGSA